jgi:hypothetical protein
LLFQYFNMRRTLCLLMLAAMVMPSTSWTADSGTPNFAYSIFAGTGVYEINDRTIYVIRAPLSFDLVEIDAENKQTTGVRLLVPFAVGVTQFEDDDDIDDFNAEDIQSFSIVPGLEIPIALSSEWQLSPFAQIGVGIDAKSDSASAIWGSGVRTRWQPATAPNWLFGGEFLWAGNNPNNDQSATDFTRWGLGTEYRQETEQVLFGRKLSWHFRLMQWYFSDAIEFEQPQKTFELNSATEVGVSVGVNKPFNILGYQAQQLGIGYEWADNYRAITFFTTFPF